MYADRATSTLDSIATAGLGTGQGFTDKDLKFLKDAKLGNITYTKEPAKGKLNMVLQLELVGEKETWLFPDSAKKKNGVIIITRININLIVVMMF